MQKTFTFWLTALAAVVPSAHGQHSATGPRSSSAPESVPPSYQSPFSTYRAYRDEPPGVWREVNDEVARVGGHAGVLKSGAEADASRPGDRVAPAAGSTPRPGQGGHHGKH